MALKELEVKYAAVRPRPYKLSDGGGLHVLVQPNGSKLWRMKYRFAGKEKLLSFGKYPEISLAVARARRDVARGLLAEGRDPGVEIAAEVQVRTNTFETVARKWHANREGGLDHAHAKRVLSRMERDVFPMLGAKPITQITAPEILAMIRKIEERGALDISRRAKQCVGQVFRFAIANGWAQDDPSVHLAGALKPRPRVKHMSRVPLKELPQLLRAIASYDGEENPRCQSLTRDALMFTMMTWARTSEVRFAVWSEFEELDGSEPLWRIPAERMKMSREHLVPLPRQAVALLRRCRSASESEFVFPGPKAGQPISENTMIYACYRMGYRRRQTVHGFRGLASTWANETEGYSSDWIEMALAHSETNSVRGAYNSALYISSRRRMLQDWADMIDGATMRKARSGSPKSNRCSEPRSAPAAEVQPPQGKPKPFLRLVSTNGKPH
ncbi:tyrosine-type recombinase/integrase [Novosphingobium sp. MBES04]|uniref:tyrosine-type recombinase/integrase n=1 Tax=Novosphingobium sp. MBES04 TaxID=1206458 RepID=UPI0007232BF1|nr:integrase arm-type DNA-binding domain-containing protein [Novosphingobium sp. MBES04]GAM07072.1 cp4-like integrase protein [Novosphingobium sp. MBES04]